jgi:hypothetical protein
MIQIHPSPTADTRTCDWSKVTRETLLASSEQHIRDIRAGLAFFADLLAQAGARHDHDKITAIDHFHSDFRTGFKQTGWWDNHRRVNRHHLADEDGIPADVNLVDVLDFVADCVMAGMARSGSVRPLALSSDLLQRAFANTAALLIANVELVPAPPPGASASPPLAAEPRRDDDATRAGWEACRAQMVTAARTHADMVGEKGGGSSEGAAAMTAVLWLASLMEKATPAPPLAAEGTAAPPDLTEIERLIAAVEDAAVEYERGGGDGRDDLLATLITARLALSAAVRALAATARCGCGAVATCHLCPGCARGLLSTSLGGEGDGGSSAGPTGNGDAPGLAVSMPPGRTPGTPTVEGFSPPRAPAPSPAPREAPSAGFLRGVRAAARVLAGQGIDARPHLALLGAETEAEIAETLARAPAPAQRDATCAGCGHAPHGEGECAGTVTEISQCGCLAAAPSPSGNPGKETNRG